MLAVAGQVGATTSSSVVRLSGHTMRQPVNRGVPSVSGRWAVWEEDRVQDDGTSMQILMAKDLKTRMVSAVGTTVGGGPLAPHTGGGWVVWSQFNPSTAHTNVYARQLTGGVAFPVDPVAAEQSNPATDGITAVWTDARQYGLQIFQKSLVGSASSSLVANASWYQDDAQVSGSTIVWLQLGMPAFSVWAKTGAFPAVSVGSATTDPNVGPQISGTRLLWAQAGASAGATNLTTCLLPCPHSLVVATDPASFSGYGVGRSRVVWSDSQGKSYVDDLGAGGSQAVLDRSTEPTSAPATDGISAVWLRGVEVWGATLPTGVPRQLSGVGLGAPITNTDATGTASMIGSLGSPYKAEVGSTLLTAKAGAVIDQTQPTVADSFVSPPGLAVNVLRVAAGHAVFEAGSNLRAIYDEDLSNRAVHQVSDATSMPADAVSMDFDGTTIAWLCGIGPNGPSQVCSEQLGSSTVAHLVLPLSYPLWSYDLVYPGLRVSQGVVLWRENGSSPPGGNVCINALQLQTGASMSIYCPFTPNPGSTQIMDLSGSTFVYLQAVPEFGGNPVIASTEVWTGAIDFAKCPAAPARCYATSQEIYGNNGTSGVADVALSGSEVAWTVCSEYHTNCQVLAEALPSGTPQVIAGPGTTSFYRPHLDGQNLMWDDGTDIYGASLGPTGTLPPPDITKTHAVTALTAAPTTGGITLSWTDPADKDIAGIRILRRAGGTAPSGPDDLNAEIVFNGNATSFNDTDVAAGQRYTYAVFAYDNQPDFSHATVTRATA